MRIRIVCPVSCAYEGDAAFVSIPSTDGEFGVLPAHSSEICTIDRSRRARLRFGDRRCRQA